MLVHMLTTVDNPFDPFDEYPAWLAFDSDHGYNSSALLGRIAQVSDESSEADERQAIEDAIDEICQENVTGMFRKVSRTLPDS